MNLRTCSGRDDEPLADYHDVVEYYVSANYLIIVQRIGQVIYTRVVDLKFLDHWIVFE